MQVYRELRILTARPSAQEEEATPHRLYGVLQASEACSAGRWLALARAAIDDTLAHGKLPIVIGGTGLYIKTLMQGIADIPDIAEDAQAEAARLWQESGPDALAQRDPIMAAQLRPSDPQRHIRALAVLLSTGKSLAHWHEQPREKLYPDAEFQVDYVAVPREELYRRCDARFLKMIEAGALEEVKSLMALGLSDNLPPMRAVGVPELVSHLKGECSLADATTKAQQTTRNYAKRQVTWFTHQLEK